MGLIEDALRDTLEAQVAAAPAVQDAAGRAISRARRTRRRRSALTTVAVVLGVAVLGAGIASIRSAAPGTGVGRPTHADANTWSIPLPADVLTGNQITLAMGPVISLAELPPARQAWRVAGGWLVKTEDPVTDMSAVWFVGQSGARTKLAQARQVAVGRSPAAVPMVAWGGGGWVSVATFTHGQLSAPISTGGTGDRFPREIVAGGVLLAEGPPGGAEAYTMWFPDRGGYVAGSRFTDPVIAVTGDGTRLLALIGLRKTCLALIEPADFAVGRSRCDLDLGRGDLVSGSADGRWLVALSRNGVDLYDFDDVWRSPAPVANWPVTGNGVAWLPDGSFVVVDGWSVTRLHTDVADRAEVAQVRLAPGEALTGIVDLRD